MGSEAWVGAGAGVLGRGWGGVLERGTAMVWLQSFTWQDLELPEKSISVENCLD